MVMNKNEIAPGIVVYSDVIPNSKNLYKDIEEGLKSTGLMWKNKVVLADGDSRVYTTTRETNTFIVPYAGKIVEEHNNPVDNLLHNFNNIFFKYFDPIEKDYMGTYGISLVWHNAYNILKYEVGQYFNNHIDDHSYYPRRMSTVYYLNENYTGGEINFPRFNVTLKPKSNQMIVFPSTYVYNHSVSPIVEGKRYAVVSWLK
jgi:hypothetical protein